MRPGVVVSFAAERDLLISGMLADGSGLANQAAVVDVPRGKGPRGDVREQSHVAE
jgi:hypothetical protein